MPTNILYLALSTLTHTLIHTFSILIFLALLTATYLIYTIRLISNLTGLTPLLSYLQNQLPTTLHQKAQQIAEERRELRRKYAAERSERLRERNLIGGKEREQMRDAVRRVAWKRGVGKLDYGIDLSEDEVCVQDPEELQEELARLEARADVGKRAGYRDEEAEAEAKAKARVVLRNGEVEAFPRFEDMETRGDWGKEK
ncbi:hypothetical protein DSL72_009048 [Monilinia vaccinii-corymbosi]|uniref:Uncharacterized protein n=1 Tax=Monilinia vaccinii-corymbosi TaxID=61207 RepID=A0A8A3PNA5_9HELO|nr:hypothetical protein DSL72_009048 [Monilinia vaccinii-corymbosi]